jgi:DNA-binding XRE family transcriptional regulator
MLKERPELTQSEIAREVGVSRQVVSKLSTNSLGTRKRLTIPVPPKVRLTLDPARVAAKIYRVRAMLKERPELTQSEIAREVGVSHQLVSRVATLPLLTQKVLRAPLLPLIRLTLDPARVAGR